MQQNQQENTMQNDDTTTPVAATPKPTPAEPTAPKKKEAAPKKETALTRVSNFTVSLTDIELPGHWNREKPGNLGVLQTSLKTVGQIVAMVVRPHPTKKGKYLLVDGRRRYMALQELKVKEAVVTFSNGEIEMDRLKALIANTNREGHNPLEIALEYSAAKESGMNNRDIARACGVSEGYVSQHLALIELDATVQKAIAKEAITLSQARVLNKVNTEEHSTYFYKLFDKMLNGMDAQSADEDAKAYLDRYAQKEKEKAAAKKAKDKAEGKPPKNEAPEKKKPGRPETKIPDYEDRKADISLVNKTTLLGYMNGTAERLSRATADKTKWQLKGILIGLEMAAGLRGGEE